MVNCHVARSKLDHEAVTNYLARQVISALPPELRSFATQVAILNYMTPNICARLLQLSDTVARDRLGALQRSTGFVSRSGQRPQAQVYRFQPQFREALLAQRGDVPGEAEQQQLALHQRAATLLQEHDDEEAIWHHAQSGNFDRIAELIEAVQDEYLRASRGLVLTRWLNLLPQAILDSRPSLALLQAELYRQSGLSRQALAMAEAVYQRIKLDGQTADVSPPYDYTATCLMAAHALVICAEAHQQLCAYQATQQASHEALSWLDHSCPSDSRVPILESLYARVYEALSAVTLLTDGPRVAEPYLQDCEQYSLYSGDLWQVGRHHYYRSKVYIAEGNFERAESAAVAALLAAQEAHDEVCAVVSRLNLGAIKMRLGRSEEAREELETALVAAESVGYTIGRLYALGNLGDVALSYGDYTHAMQLYEQTLEGLLSVEDPHLRRCVLSDLGYALTLSGRPEEALIRLTPLLEPALEPDGTKLVVASGDDVVVALSLGFAYLHHGLLSYAASLFVQAEAAACGQQRHLKAAQAHLFLAALRLAESDNAGAEVEVGLALDYTLRVPDGLALAVELRKVPELWPVFESLGQPLATDLVRTAKSGLLESSGRKWSPQAVGRRAGVSMVHPIPADTSIRVFMFGQPRILVGTTYVARWKKPAARDLLLFLLDYRKPASRETILTALWPDVDPQVSDVWFRQARFHLKRTLQVDDCLVQEESGYWRLELPCWVDVYEAEQLVDAGTRLLATSGTKSAGADQLRQALTLWNGSYLDDIYSDWAAARRQELYQRRLALMEQLAILELDAGMPDRAMQLYQQLLATEPLFERAHRGLMECFVARGEPSRAIQQFRDYSTLLREQLDTVPAHETIALQQMILQEMETTKRALA